MWKTYELELINYQNKCRLIRGWDDLFNKVKEHINSVAAMKLSPYYKVCVMTICVGCINIVCICKLTVLGNIGEIQIVNSMLCMTFQEFEEEALSWEDKLNRINALFDVWIDVQRRWVYLEGIFTGSADIKHLLPIETSRFQRYAILCLLSSANLVLYITIVIEVFSTKTYYCPLFVQRVNRVPGLDEESLQVSACD